MSARIADDTDKPVEREGVRERVGQRDRASRVVRCVKQHGRAAPNDLEPPGRRRHREPVADYVHVQSLLPAAEERFDRGQRHRCVVRLMCAVQRQHDLVVLPAEPAQRQQLSANRDRAVEDAEVQALARNRRLNLGDPPQQHLGYLDRLLGDDRDRPRLDDPALLKGDVDDRFAEVLLVVERDRRDDGHLPVDNIGRVPCSARGPPR